MPNDLNMVRFKVDRWLSILKNMLDNEITNQIIGRAIKIHKSLGPGLLESAYEACLYHEIVTIGLFAERQKAIPLIYETVKLDCGRSCRSCG